MSRSLALRAVAGLRGAAAFFFGAASLLAAGCGCAFGLAFHENLAFKVFSGDAPAREARLYDSEDFQQILLLPGHGAPLVLDLATESVYALSPEQVSGTLEDPVVDAFDEGTFATLFVKEEGVITIPLEDATYRLSPAPPLVGPASLDELLAAKPIYGIDAAQYAPDSTAVGLLAAVDRPVELFVYFGTWCHLCKRLVPQVLKTLEAAGNANIRVQYIGLDEEMAEPVVWIDRHGVEKTPTLIFVEGGREVGRIEERAEPTVEAAMADILSRR